MSGGECFYIGKDGKATDAGIHDDILAEGKPKLAETIKLAKSLGLSDTEIAALYGPLKPKSDAFPQAE